MKRKITMGKSKGIFRPTKQEEEKIKEIGGLLKGLADKIGREPTHLLREKKKQKKTNSSKE